MYPICGDALGSTFHCTESRSPEISAEGASTLASSKNVGVPGCVSASFRVTTGTTVCFPVLGSFGVRMVSSVTELLSGEGVSAIVSSPWLNALNSDSETHLPLRIA